MTEQAAVVEPHALRLSYVPFEDPVTWESRGLTGEMLTFTYRGALRVEWDSPEGLFTYLTAEKGDPGVRAYDELRPYLAEIVQAAYEQARDRREGT